MKAIKVENLSKAYQLGEIGTGTLSNDLKRWAYKVRGKDDPFLKIGETNDRTTKGESNMVWSLKDLDFEIEQGDAVGIIGRNGAGKSTLLKILSRVTSPTTGSVKVKGRVASLLEVGTGFHPELTGRENIFLNGAILGMRKKEISRKFDEIVNFAGIERYIDTPVKRYSSGMYVRLAFAVAAHLDSEILVVDEVLAVGDAEFQKKCLGKMNDVSKSEGRTILFVSHNLSAIKELCQMGILLENGKLSNYNSIDIVTQEYLQFDHQKSKYTHDRSKINKLGFIHKIDLFSYEKKITNSFKAETISYASIKYEIVKPTKYFNIGFTISDTFDTHLYSSSDTDKLTAEQLIEIRQPGLYNVIAPIPLYNLNSGNYKITFIMGEINTTLFDSVEIFFSIENNNFLNTGNRTGILLSLNKWQYTD
ncbi:ABC transporter ATP-binding protein [Pedobacter cryophilus]|nr:ABC transporter ATP-binding protein [Pedobacter cryophilus]